MRFSIVLSPIGPCCDYYAKYLFAVIRLLARPLNPTTQVLENAVTWYKNWPVSMNAIGYAVLSPVVFVRRVCVCVLSHWPVVRFGLNLAGHSVVMSCPRHSTPSTLHLPCFLCCCRSPPCHVSSTQGYALKKRNFFKYFHYIFSFGFLGTVIQFVTITVLAFYSSNSSYVRNGA